MHICGKGEKALEVVEFEKGKECVQVIERERERDR